MKTYLVFDKSEIDGGKCCDGLTDLSLLNHPQVYRSMEEAFSNLEQDGSVVEFCFPNSEEVINSINCAVNGCHHRKFTIKITSHYNKKNI